jgi:hypothetical protein
VAAEQHDLERPHDQARISVPQNHSEHAFIQ